MNIRAPFGRQEKKREREYASLRQKLPGAGVTTRADTEQLTLLLMLLIPEGHFICGTADIMVMPVGTHHQPKNSGPR